MEWRIKKSRFNFQGLGLQGLAKGTTGGEFRVYRAFIYIYIYIYIYMASIRYIDLL